MKIRSMSVCMAVLVVVAFTGCGKKNNEEAKAPVEVVKKEVIAKKVDTVATAEEKITQVQENTIAEKKKRGNFRYTQKTTIDQLLWHYNTVEEKFAEFKDKIYSKDLQLKLYKASNGRLYFTSLVNHGSIYVYCTNFGAKPSLEEFKNLKDGKMIVIKSPKENSKFLNSSKHRPINVHNKEGLKNRAYFLDDNRVYMMSNGVLTDFVQLKIMLSKIEKVSGL